MRNEMQVELYHKMLIHDERTEHTIMDRQTRYNVAKELIKNENAELCDTFLIDRNHRNGKELHNVFSNGIVKIYNYDTYKLVTVLIAQPYQIRRYYERVEIELNSKIEIEKAEIHIKNKLNKIA